MGSHFVDIITQIAEELCGTLAGVDQSQIDRLLGLLASKPRIFVTGEGRSGLVMRMFAMRLMHLGQCAFVVGDVTTPAIAQGDLLIICSGSGETMIPCIRAERAAQLGAIVVAICGREHSRLTQSASVTFLLLPSTVTEPSTATDQSQQRRTVQFGGSRFEQSAFLFCDTVAYLAMQSWSIDPAEMQARHANLE